jgi:hypothetical protein
LSGDPTIDAINAQRLSLNIIGKRLSGRDPYVGVNSAPLLRELVDLSHTSIAPTGGDIRVMSDLINDIPLRLSDKEKELLNAIKNSSKEAAAVAAIPTAALAASAMSPEAKASTDPDLMRQVAPPPPNYDKWGVLPEGKEPRNLVQEATDTLGGVGAEKIQEGLETLDKYTARPVRAAAYGALKGENPLTSAYGSIKDDKDVSGGEVAREFLKRSEQGGMSLRAPGQEDYPAEAPLGLMLDIGLDPSNLIGAGSAKNALKYATDAAETFREAGKVTEKSLPALLDLLQQRKLPIESVTPRIEPSFSKLKGLTSQ